MSKNFRLCLRNKILLPHKNTVKVFRKAKVLGDEQLTSEAARLPVPGKNGLKVDED